MEAEALSVEQSPATGLTRASVGRIARLVFLYVAQGIPFGFATLYVPLQLAGRADFSYAKTTLFTLANFPWVLKMVWAPAADTRFWPRLGRRKSWILPAQGALAVTALLGMKLDFNGPLLPLFLFVSLLNLWASVQDTAVDGLAVEMLTPTERGLGNAAQVGGYKLGMVVGGSWLTIVAAREGTTAAMIAMGGTIALLMLAPLTYREGPPPVREPGEKKEKARGAVQLLLRELREPGWIQTLVFIGTVKVGESMVSGLIKPWLKHEAHFTDEEAAFAVGLAGMSASLVGSALGGWAAGKLGRKRALFLFSIVQAIVLAGFGFALTQPVDKPFLVVAVAVEHFAAGLLTPALFAYMMDVVDPKIGATHYTVLATVEVLAKGAAGALAGGVLEVTGVPVPVFMLATGLVGALPLLLMPKIRDPFDPLRDAR